MDMNSIKIKIFLMLITTMVSKGAPAYRGEWVHKIDQDGRIDHTPIRFYSQKKLYVKGGTWFDFPVGYFRDAPHVYVSAKLNKLEYTPSLVVNTFITHLSPLLVRVSANKVSVGFIKNAIIQADTDDILVYILAYGF
jgi:hypothetical protein